MEQILIKEIQLPSWSFKNIDPENFKSLSDSILKNGQTKSITVRRLENNKYEVVDGKNVFKIIKNLEVDYVWCHVLRDMTDIESKLFYLENDFYFENNFVKISKVLEEVCKKKTKLQVSKTTKYSYNEIKELLSLALYDFSKFKTEKKHKQNDLF